MAVARDLIATAAEDCGIIFHKQFSQMSAFVDAFDKSSAVVRQEQPTSPLRTRMTPSDDPG